MGVIIIKIIRHKTPVEEAFIIWMNGFPDSGHPCDRQRFYQFVHSIISYGSTSWYNKNKFRKKILELKPFFKEEDIDLLFNRLMIIQEYNKSSQLQTITTMDSDCIEYFQNQVIKNRIESVKITEDEYNKRGISKKEFLNRLHK